MFAADGNGVTFMSSAVQDLVERGNVSDVKGIEVVWCISDPGVSLAFVAARQTTFISPSLVDADNFALGGIHISVPPRDCAHRSITPVLLSVRG
jgi:hypothetical protein